MITGYKWTERRSDNKLFIVTLECHNEFIDEGEGRKPDKITFYADNKSFYTTDCIVKKIEDEEGNTVESVDGKAFYPFVYTVGGRITGKRIFYMHDREYLAMYAGKKWRPAVHRLCEIMEMWTAAGNKVISNPLYLLCGLDNDSFYRMREREFFQMGGTLEDLHILELDGII